MLLYLVGGVAVFVGSGVMAMAGLGAAFLFVPLFFYLGVPLGQATSTALLLNAVSLSAATIAYARGGLVDWRAGIPVLIAAVILAPLGASLTVAIDQQVLLGLFVGFLVFAGVDDAVLPTAGRSARPRARRRRPARARRSAGWPASSAVCSGWAAATSSSPG